MSLIRGKDIQVLPLYEGILRVLRMLESDFPEFLCYNHFSLCDFIPPHNIELRSIILRAIPGNLRIPDPSNPDLQVDLHAEMSQPPCILSDFDAALKSSNMKSLVDEYLMTRPEDSTFLSQLKYRMLLPSKEAERSGTRYNVPLMNSLVFYVGTKVLQQERSSTTSPATSIIRSNPVTSVFSAAALNIFLTLINDLGNEGSWLFFNAVANHLRYPNNHTQYFSSILLHLFTEINHEPIQKQITIVLLQLLINRPYPWGAMITFIELTTKPHYNFWNLSFTKRDPEIKRIFKSVSTMCASLVVEEKSGVSGVVPDNTP